jgi:hypothetical protein
MRQLRWDPTTHIAGTGGSQLYPEDLKELRGAVTISHFKKLVKSWTHINHQKTVHSGLSFKRWYLHVALRLISLLLQFQSKHPNLYHRLNQFHQWLLPSNCMAHIIADHWTKLSSTYKFSKSDYSALTNIWWILLLLLSPAFLYSCFYLIFLLLFISLVSSSYWYHYINIISFFDSFCHTDNTSLWYPCCWYSMAIFVHLASSYFAQQHSK